MHGEIYPGQASQQIVHQNREQSGHIRFEEQGDALYVTTEGILGIPTLRLIGEPKPCFLNGERISPIIV